MTKIELEIKIEDWKQGFISDTDLKTAIDAYCTKENDEVKNIDWRDYLYIYLIVFYVLFWMIYALFNL